MKYKTINELDHFMFRDAHIAEAGITPGSFYLLLDNVTILPENSHNRDIRQMRANQLRLTICEASLSNFVEESYRVYDANGNLKEQTADRALAQSEYAEGLRSLTDCTIFSIEKKNDVYEISIDTEDHTILLEVAGKDSYQEWDRFLNKDSEF